MILIIGALLGLSSIILGAYVDHAFKYISDPKTLESVLTAIRYQQLHAVLITVMGFHLYLSSPISKYLRRSAWIFILGIIFFSFSIYAAKLFRLPILLKFTPIGGMILMLGWIYLVWIGLTKKI